MTLTIDDLKSASPFREMLAKQAELERENGKLIADHATLNLRLAETQAENAQLRKQLADRVALIDQVARRNDQLFNRLCRYEVPPQPES